MKVSIPQKDGSLKVIDMPHHHHHVVQTPAPAPALSEVVAVASVPIATEKKAEKPAAKAKSAPKAKPAPKAPPAKAAAKKK